MNPSEEQQLIRFLGGLVNAAPPQVDSQAQRLIEQAFARQPQAAYLLTQRALALSMAVEAAQQKIAQLEADAASTSPGRPQSSAGSAALVSSQAWGRQSGPLPKAQPPFGAQPAVGAQPQAQSSWSQGLMGSLVGAAAGVMIGQALWHGVQQMIGSPGGAGAEASASGLDGAWSNNPVQQAQSDWTSSLAPQDEGFVDGGEGDDWF
ncbi:MAG: DUF2076 family protein [Betaproteobacteria bacterium]|nr:DUF2076 family protein [Betaproteobacteria bacterium]NCY19468.1 DUF2076 family protein [Betaproteobacteria bacterium]NDB98060.1 DUF2076 family protein [Betaproteobacteria bacterium]NDC67234.1 DUF2076 family protein [Betaproteobacteria bacterium]NDF92088.1 DUF2076 family protein [Betaproteobacteria bacterium]